MINALIVDNEEHFVMSFSKLLDIHFPEINIIGNAYCISDAVKIIHSLKPDLVFLDIEMDDETGFDLFRYFTNIEFDIVFITSHDEYAIKAIKYSAFDYILKPVNIEDLNNTIARFKNKITHSKDETIKLLLENIRFEQFKKIAVSTSKGVRIITIDEISYCQADASYAYIYLKNKERITITKSLKYVEEMLPSEIFFRTHKSYLININHIKEFVNIDGGVIILNDSSRIPVSVRKRDWIIRFLKSI